MESDPDQCGYSMVTIVNAVGSGDLGVELDLQNLGTDLSVPSTEYDPSNYHGLYVRLEEEALDHRIPKREVHHQRLCELRHP